jgi:hypothetical protein
MDRKKNMINDMYAWIKFKFFMAMYSFGRAVNKATKRIFGDEE